jgi:SAM-dependent methyltransferase
MQQNMNYTEKQTETSLPPSAGTHEAVGNWHQARADFILDCVRKFKDPNKSFLALDIGSGNAYFATAASKKTNWKFTCFDPAYNNTHHNSRAIKYSNLIPNTKFDVIFILDVLEHIEQEESLLSRLDQILKRDSLIVITVPMWPNLFGLHDKTLGHQRRYKENEVNELFREIHLNCVFETQFFFFPLVFRYLEKKLNFYKSRELNSSLVFKPFFKFDIFMLSLFLKLGLKYYGLSWLGIYQKDDTIDGNYTFH